MRAERPGRQGATADESKELALPEAFLTARSSIAAAKLRPEIELEPLPSPRGIAPFSIAVAATVVVPGEHGAEVLGGPEARDDDDEQDLASGKFVLFHDPRGQDAWQGTFRVVTLVRAELEPDIADDPLLPEVGWAWLLDALRERGVAFHAEGGTVSRCASRGFGSLADRPQETSVEIRASWTPADEDFGAHLEAWSSLLSMSAGLPPDIAGVVPLVGAARRVNRTGGSRPRRDTRR
jgi:hypothetical protein